MQPEIQFGEVHNFTSSKVTGWYHVSFPRPFRSQPVVNAQIQTFNGQDTPGLRIDNVSAIGFDVRMDEIYASHCISSVSGPLGTVSSDQQHPNPETLGWIAVGA